MKTVMRKKKLIILPVRRRLMGATLAYLTGIFTASIVIIPIGYIGIVFALLSVWTACRLLRRKGAFFCVLACMLLLGHMLAGAQLLKQDMPTASGVQLSGMVESIEKPYRVMLRDVTIDGKAMDNARPVVVTLMQEEDGEIQSIPEPRVGQRVSGTGRLFEPDAVRNPGGVSWRVQSICKGYELSGYLLPGWTVEGEGAFSLKECMRCLRNAIIGRAGMLFGDQAALFQGVMLGDKSALDDEVTAAMRLTGTVHVLTVSGLHLSLIAHVISRLLDRAPIRRRSRFALLSAFLVFFTSLTGAAAGTVRACIMAILREYAVVRGRRYEPLTALSFAALCMTLVQPLWLLNASFQFSFFVVLGIQLFSRSFSDAAARLLPVKGAARAVLALIAVSLSAQLASVPMQLLLYGYVPLLSLPMNLLCSVFMPYLLVGGWSVTMLSVLSMDAALWAGSILARLAAWFEALSLWAASLDGAALRLPSPFGISVLLFALLMLLLSSRIRFGNGRKLAACLTAGLLLISYLLRLVPFTGYVQLDVGQGDAALFRRGRHAVLVDVGPTDSYDMLRYLRREGLYVDAVILSHLDEDHAGALLPLISSEVEIPAVIMAEDARREKTSLEVQAAFELLGQRKTAMHEVDGGDRIEVCGVTFDVLSPDKTLVGSNERSLLLHAVTQDVSFLLTGDLPESCEPAHVPDVDVLKVAHHGSKNATSDRFLEQARPEFTLISVGAGNRYGHPAKRVLDALDRIDAQVLRTDQCGCVTLCLREGEIDVWRYLKTAL